MGESTIALFTFGTIATVIRIVLAVAIPHPTPSQESTFRTVMALACAGVGAALPGTLQVSPAGVQSTISATGAIAVFVFVYLVNPGANKVATISNIDAHAPAAAAETGATKSRTQIQASPSLSPKTRTALLVYLFCGLMIGAMLLNYFISLQASPPPLSPGEVQPERSLGYLGVLRIAAPLIAASVGFSLPKLVSAFSYEKRSAGMLVSVASATCLAALTYFIAL